MKQFYYFLDKSKGSNINERCY